MPSGIIKYFKSTLKLLFPAAIALYFLSCATIVAPSGGPKDVTPPKMISSQPKDLSTNFKGNKIILNFDEYVQLKTPEKFLLISPPLSKLPDIKIKGHSVVIKLEDTLRSNTTYNFYFGDAIVDIAENNPISNFNFAFSTGPEIDSLSLSGNVTHALSRMPAVGAIVMLYEDFTDSVPMKQIPTYVSRTSENGNFHLNSLASGKYRAVALMDMNNDYMYDLPNELIGFSSDSVQPYHNAINLNDSVAVQKTDLKTQNLVSINIFPEPDSTQRILKSMMAARNRLSIAFRYPMKSPEFRVLNIPDSLPWAIREWNSGNDTLSAWLLNQPDTLKLEVSDQGMVLDTVKIATVQKASIKSRRSETSTGLGYSTSLYNRMLGYNKPLILTFNNPVKEHDFKAMSFSAFTTKDTATFVPEIRFADSIQRRLLISYNWNATTSYDAYIPKGSFTDIYRDSCDSTHVVFQMKAAEVYGKFAVTINRRENNYPVIIQLLNEKGLVLDQRILTTDNRADFGLLSPAKYGLKAIMDVNSNGRWDTGEFLKKIQPEIVIVHPKIFQVRTNWELEETWDL